MLPRLRLMWEEGWVHFISTGLGFQWSWESEHSRKFLIVNGEPAGTRTQGPRLKRAMLYRLSYRLTERMEKES